jgi:hypothetical protein
LGVAVAHVLDGCGGLAERVGLVDDWPDLAGLDQFGEREQVRCVLRADQRGQRLAGEPGEEQRPELAVAASCSSSLPSSIANEFQCQPGHGKGCEKDHGIVGATTHLHSDRLMRQLQRRRHLLISSCS